MAINILFTGGLGNQMHQYAFGRRLESLGNEVTFNRTSRELFVNVREREEADYRPAPNLGANDAMRYVSAFGLDLYNTKITYGPPQGEYHDCGVLWDQGKQMLNAKSPITLRGIWQSEKYFEAIASRIREELTLTSVPIEIERFVEGIKNSNSVFMHVRRGDYTTTEVCLIWVWYP